MRSRRPGILSLPQSFFRQALPPLTDRELVVALDTVKKHVTHVLGKLGAANRTEAAARARQLGLIP